MKKNFGKTIKEARIKNNLTMQDVVDLIGTTTGYITKIEKHNELPSKEVFKKLCKTLNLNTKKMIELVIKNKLEIYEKLLREKYE